MQEIQKPFDIPIVLIVFNRIDLVEKQIEILKKIEPKKMLVVCDAPKNEKDCSAVKSIRALFEHLPWNCTVLKNYAEENMGCDRRITSGLDWAFEHVDKAIILEDDCIPSLDFFRYAEELLLRYEKEHRVYYISGQNEINKYRLKDSYAFVYRAGTWGWATWKRAWDTFDYESFVENWDEEKRKKIRWQFLLPGDRHHWIKCIEINRRKGSIPWDYCWVWHAMKNNGFSIVPQKNMIENIGFRTDATHTTEKPEKYDGTIRKMYFPLKHPIQMKLDKRFYFENWKYEKPNYLKKLVDIKFYKRQWKKIMKNVKV